MPWILNCCRLPGLYTREDVRNRLGLRDDDAVSKIVKAKLIRPLGNRQGKQQMYFWSEDIEALVRNRSKMERVVRVIQGADEPKSGKTSD